jgi:uncharacterized membrane protein YgdD (TMEM256/DUF423 family)
MSAQMVRIIGALLGCVGVLAAAFGAHGLEKITDARGVRLWAIAAALELVTAPVVLWCSSELDAGRISGTPPLLIVIGVTVFSGTLYAMAVGAPKVLGAITPLGGLALAVGWLWLAFQNTRG